MKVCYKMVNCICWKYERVQSLPRNYFPVQMQPPII